MTKHNSILNLDTAERMDIGTYLLEQINDYMTNTRGVRVSPELRVDAVVEHVRRLSFEHPVSAREAINHILDGLRQYQGHTPHPRYFGLYNPRPTFMGIMADTITASFNPQLAAWSHAPVAVEMENYVLKEIASKFGYSAHAADGTFTTGGAEANQMAILTALVHCFPSYAKEGLRSLPTHPTEIHACPERNISWHINDAKFDWIFNGILESVKHTTGNTVSLTTFQFELASSIDVYHQIQVDRAAGYTPFLIIATGGTTGAGAL